MVRAASPGRSAQGLQQRRACSISGAGTCLTSRADSLWQLPAAGPRWSLARRVGARPPSSSGCIMFFAALIGRRALARQSVREGHLQPGGDIDERLKLVCG